MKSAVMKYKALILAGLFYAIAIPAYAQTARVKIEHLNPSRPGSHRKLDLEYIPFGSIRVIDSRPDTMKLFTNESGEYPPRVFDFDTIASTAMEQYFNDIANNLPRGKVQLIVNVRQLYIPNQRFVLRSLNEAVRIFGYPVRRAGSTWTVEQGNSTFLVADVFYKSDELHYRRIFTMHGDFVFKGPSYVAETIELLLNNLFESSCVAYERENGLKIKTKRWLRKWITNHQYFSYERASEEIASVELDKRAEYIQEKFSISKTDPTLPGRYDNFDNFRDNKIDADSVNMRYDSKDSVYRVVFHDKDSARFERVYALSDGKSLYFQIARNSYLKLYRKDASFCFFVPWSMPDMYALLSIMWARQFQHQHLNLYGSSGNIFADIAALSTAAIVEKSLATDDTNEWKKIILNGLKHDFRNCLINMENGDILYSQGSAPDFSPNVALYPTPPTPSPSAPQ